MYNTFDLNCFFLSFLSSFVFSSIFLSLLLCSHLFFLHFSCFVFSSLLPHLLNVFFSFSSLFELEIWNTKIVIHTIKIVRVSICKLLSAREKEKLNLLLNLLINIKVCCSERITTNWYIKHIHICVCVYTHIHTHIHSYCHYLFHIFSCTATNVIWYNILYAMFIHGIIIVIS